MTGKELKAFAERVSDEAMIEVDAADYARWTEKFKLRAIQVWPKPEKERE